LLPADERRRVLTTVNDTATHYEPVCLHRLFESMAAAEPDSVAVVAPDGTEITYRQLDTAANQLAHRLRRHGVGPEATVGISLHRGVDLVLALLATWKAGGAYVPLDPDLPPKRLAHMLADADPALVITLCEAVPGATSVLALETERQALAGEPIDAPAGGADLDDLAYVLYTSGSTGTPKGVEITHRGIHNRIAWMQDAYPLTGRDRVLQKTPYSFDVSVWEFFWPLVTGARLVLAAPGGHRDPAHLQRLIAEQQVTTMHFVPTMLRAFLDDMDPPALRSLRRVFCSGEPLPADAVNRFLGALPDVELHNLYGPTEASVDATAWRCTAGATTVPIGRPIANMRTYILDDAGQPMPLGVPGELCLAGVGLARGYRNRPDDTAAAFVDDPFTPGGRLYRTGDLARLLPSGDIEFLGRIDGQVKLRGYRVELDEVAAAMRRHPGVTDAVAAVVDDRLVGYPVGDVDVAELRATLASWLPEYMRPAVFVPIDAVPLTPSGKADRRALPAPVSGPVLTGHVAPVGAMEELMAEIWAAVLGVERVGATDDFFALGGDSVTAIRIVARAKAVGVLTTPQLLFRAPTVRDLAALSSSSADTTTTAVVADSTGTHRTTELQRRLLQAPDPAAGMSHVLLSLATEIDPDAMRAAWQRAVDDHPILRTSFATSGGVPVAVVHPVGVGVPFEFRDLSGDPDADREIAATTRELRGRGFAASDVPQLRLVLFRCGAADHRLLWVSTLRLMDGWSSNRVLNAAMAVYLGDEPPMSLPHQAYTTWLAGQEWMGSQSYWRDRFAGVPDVAVEPPVRDYHQVRSGLDEAETARLTDALRAHGLTVATAALAAWAVTTARRTGSSDVVFGVVLSGRAGFPHPEELTGTCTNILPLRVRMPAGETAAAWLTRLQTDITELGSHELTPPDAVERWTGREPLFDSHVVMENFYVDPALDGRLAAIGVTDVDWLMQTDSPLRLEILPGRRLELALSGHRTDLADLAAGTRDALAAFATDLSG
jgi:amino acid adenylation domain-containing protein